MKKTKVLLAGLSLLLCAGCVNLIVPKTTIKGSIAGAPFAISSPKDSTLNGLNIVAYTNGEVQVHIDSLTAKMNPDVISMSAAAQVDIINAMSAAIQSAMASGAKAAK